MPKLTPPNKSSKSLQRDKPILVYLVDDHAVVREGYKILLEKANIQIVAEAASGEEAIKNFEQQPIDLIIMDISMPGISGILAIQKILAKRSNTKILAFSMHEDVVFISHAMQAGACGYVTKSSAPDVLVEAVKVVANGSKYISHDIAHKISLKLIKPQGSLESLTQREFEVFALLGKGMTLEDIAKTLALDYKTIANIQTRLRHKLKLENSAQLLLAAIKHNVLLT